MDIRLQVQKRLDELGWSAYRLVNELKGKKVVCHFRDKTKLKEYTQVMKTVPAVAIYEFLADKAALNSDYLGMVWDVLGKAENTAQQKTTTPEKGAKIKAVTKQKTTAKEDAKRSQFVLNNICYLYVKYGGHEGCCAVSELADFGNHVSELLTKRGDIADGLFADGFLKKTAGKISITAKGWKAWSRWKDYPMMLQVISDPKGWDIPAEIARIKKTSPEIAEDIILRMEMKKQSKNSSRQRTQSAVFEGVHSPTIAAKKATAKEDEPRYSLDSKGNPIPGCLKEDPRQEEKSIRSTELCNALEKAGFKVNENSITRISDGCRMYIHEIDWNYVCNVPGITIQNVIDHYRNWPANNTVKKNAKRTGGK